jgi:hypothetical protein
LFLGFVASGSLEAAVASLNVCNALRQTTRSSTRAGTRVTATMGVAVGGPGEGLEARPMSNVWKRSDVEAPLEP